MAAITAAVVTTAGTMYAANRAKKQQEQAGKDAREMAGIADPYAAFRGDAAARLDALQKDPSSIENSAVWKARQQAAARAIASQGYTGSGNAIVAAADAGASAYQQEFDNLARLSGADVGLQSAAGVASAGLGTTQDARNSYLSSIGGVVNNLGNLATTVGGRFNQPAPATTPTGTGPG
jgi:hypothetical protein